jgi:hypothetical protein
MECEHNHTKVTVLGVNPRYAESECTNCGASLELKVLDDLPVITPTESVHDTLNRLFYEFFGPVRTIKPTGYVEK